MRGWGFARCLLTVVSLGYEKLEHKRVPTPVPGAGEVLLQVLAAGVNNTEINTRLGWYSKAVSTSTDEAAEQQGAEAEHKSDGGWSAATPWPLIQGTDCCGLVVSLGEDVADGLLGRRSIVRCCNRTNGFDSWESVWMASDYDGAFAQFVKVRASEVFPVNCSLSDAELGAVPCAYGTAEALLVRANVCADDHVLVVGASGGVTVIIYIERGNEACYKYPVVCR